jgi:TonB family protein
MKAALILLAGLWTGDFSEPVPVLSAPAPQFAELAFMARIQTEVRVGVTVLPDGTVGEVGFVGQRPPLKLDLSIVDAVRKWLFAPSEEAERKVELVFDFRIAGGCEPPPPLVERLSAYHLRIWRQEQQHPVYSMVLKADGTSECIKTVPPCPGGVQVNRARRPLERRAPYLI